MDVLTDTEVLVDPIEENNSMESHCRISSAWIQSVSEQTCRHIAADQHVSALQKDD